MDRFCPLCDHYEFNVIQKIEQSKINYIIGKCKQCNFVYVTNPNLNTVNQEENLDITKTTLALPKKRHFQVKRLIDKHYKNQQIIKVIEIGSGYGALAKIISSDSQYSYYGFEPNITRANVCQNYGLNVSNCFFSSDAVDFSADAIVIDNVLEHVLEPKKLIATAVKVLNNQGILIVIVPNFQDIRQFKTSWRERHFWQPWCHINYFTSFHLRKLFQEFNVTFSPFGLSSLNLKTDLLFVPKVFFDSINIYRMGLYCYGIKQS